MRKLRIIRRDNASKIRILEATIRKRGGSFSIFTIGVPKERRDIRKNWVSTIKSVLKSMKKLHAVEYLLVLEISTDGFFHAHMVLLRLVGGKYTSLDRALVDEFKLLFFRKLYQKIMKKTVQAYLKKPTRWFLEKLKLQKGEILTPIRTFKHGDKVLAAGKNSGFINYLLDKPELMNINLTKISTGLKSQTFRKLRRFEPKGWGQKVNEFGEHA